MPLQNHIHISRTLGPAPENAPDISWRVIERMPTPHIIASFERAMNGTLRRHALRRNGNIVKLVDYKFSLRIGDGQDGMTSQQRLDALIDMLGEEVYFVDNEHANNGSDHTANIKPMVVTSVGEFNNIHPALGDYIVTIELTDNSLT